MTDSYKEFLNAWIENPDTCSSSDVRLLCQLLLRADCKLKEIKEYATSCKPTTGSGLEHIIELIEE